MGCPGSGRSSATGRSSPPTRRSTSATRSRPWRRRRRTSPRRRRAWSRSTTRSCRRSSRFRARSPRARRWFRTRRCGRTTPSRNTNVLREHVIGWGDVDAAAADLVVEHVYRFPMVTQFAIEPHAFIAAPDGDGVAVWSSIQHPYWLQRILARVLGLPLAKVRVHAPDPGGAFGGKQHAKYEPLLAFMALALGQPVRLTLSLEESFLAVRRTETEIRVRTGVNARRHRSPSRTLMPATSSVPTPTLPTAWWARARTSATAPTTGRPRASTRAACCRTRCPRPPSVASATRRSTGRSSRTSARPPSSWALIRWRCGCAIWPAKATRSCRSTRRAMATGQQSVQRVRELIEWDTPVPAGRGRGIALGIKSGPTTGLSYSLVRLLADGSAVVYCGTSDMGQGARTIFAQMCAQELGAGSRARHGRRRRHGGRALRPADVGIAIDRPDGQCGRVRGAPGSPALWSRWPGADDQPTDELVRRALGRMGGEISAIGEARKDADPEHPLGARLPSSSSMPRPSRSALTPIPAMSPSIATRPSPMLAGRSTRSR